MFWLLPLNVTFFLPYCVYKIFQNFTLWGLMWPDSWKCSSPSSSQGDGRSVPHNWRRIISTDKHSSPRTGLFKSPGFRESRWRSTCVSQTSLQIRLHMLSVRYPSANLECYSHVYQVSSEFTHTDLLRTLAVQRMHWLQKYFSVFYGLSVMWHLMS